MKQSAAVPDRHAHATWPLPEPALAYFPNARFGPALASFPDARFGISDRDLGARAAGRVAMTGSQGPHGHLPVLLDRCVELLAPALTAHSADATGAVLVDATLGAGGHTERLLTDFPGLRVIGLDRDPTALDIAGQRLSRFGDRLTLVRTRYDGIADALIGSGLPDVESVAGVLFDLGVSSMQLDRVERGFSYSADAPLDMRMDPDLPMTAADLLNTAEPRELARILREYGEEKFASRIARLVVRRRETIPFERTGDLVELLYEAIPAPARRTGGHPAKRSFQALRVAVNAELDSLREALPAALDAVAVGGRVVVMAYQSLEDRIVKSAFTQATASRTPPGLPIELPGHEPLFSAVTRGAERADSTEIDRNPRSAAARLRTVQRMTGGSLA